MKNLKTIVLTAVIVALVALLIFVVWNSRETHDIRKRIGQAELIKREQQLIHDIMDLRFKTAVIQAKFKPAPQKQPAPPQVKE